MNDVKSTLKTREDAPFSRVELLRHLDDKKVGTRLQFGGNLIRQPYFQALNYRVASNLPNTDHVMNNAFWIGVFPSLSKEMLDYITENINEFGQNA